MSEHPQRPTWTRSTAIRHLLTAIAAATVAAAVWLGRCGIIDDAFIYARAVRNFVDGGALSFQAEPVNCLSSPLWSWLWALVAAGTGGHVLAVGAALAGLCLLLAGWAWSSLLATCLPAAAAWSPLAFLFLATSPFAYATLGMETPLLLAGLGVLAVGLARDRARAVWLAAACVCATRCETALLLAPTLCVWVRRRGRRAFRLAAVAPAFALLIAMPALQTWQYGTLLPSTLAAKMAQGAVGLGAPFWRIGDHLAWYFDSSPLRVALVFVLAAVGIGRLRRCVYSNSALLGLALLLAFYLAIGICNFHWYWAPCYLASWCYGTVGAGVLGERLATAASGARRAGRLALGVALAWLVGGGGAGTLAQAVAARPAAHYEGIGRWLHQFAPHGSSVALAEIGTVGWYSKLRIVDMMGLATPDVVAPMWQRDFTGWWRLHRPDLAVVHEPMWPIEASIAPALAKGDYEVVAAARLQGFRLLRRVR